MRKGFTIIELLIVVVVIAIIAAITLLSYNGISNRAKETALLSDLKNAATQLAVEHAANNAYPPDISAIKKSEGTTFQNYSYTDTSFCLEGISSQVTGRTFYVSSSEGPGEGVCPATSVAMQTTTKDNCPAYRTLGYDVRDNRTYWIQKMSDGQCWMLTNLAYAGGTSNGGTNSYGDAKIITHATSGRMFTEAQYYTHSNANPTMRPLAPSTSSDGGVVSPQYGYHYNWCAAMGVQTSTSACADASTPIPNPGTSICPAGWRLPTGSGGSNELQLLINALGGTNGSQHSANLRSIFLMQYAGYWFNSFDGSGAMGDIWSSTQDGASWVYGLTFQSSTAFVGNGFIKSVARPVRCIAI